MLRASARFANAGSRLSLSLRNRVDKNDSLRRPGSSSILKRFDSRRCCQCDSPLHRWHCCWLRSPRPKRRLAASTTVGRSTPPKRLDVETETAKDTGAPERLRITIGKDVTLEFRLIPAGKFMMGSPKEEPGHEGDEPLHEETVAEPFYLMETQLTLEAHRALLGGDPPGPQASDDLKLPARVMYRDAVDKIGPALAKVALKGWTPILVDRVRLEYAARAGVAGMNPGGDGEKAAEPYA